MAHGHGHSIDEYLEVIYFLAFPIGEYRPGRRERDRLARGGDARRLARVRGRDAEAARGRGPRRARRAEGGDPHADRDRARRARRAQAPADRALPHRLHGLHGLRVAREGRRDGRHVHRRHDRADQRAARLPRPLPARLADRDRRRAGRERGARLARPAPAGAGRPRSCGWPSTTATSCTGSTTRASCPASLVEVRELQAAAGQVKIVLSGAERAIAQKAAEGLYVRPAA